MLFTKKSRPLLGVDISTSSVKLIEIGRSGSTYKVECYAAEAMPPNAVTDKVITDVEACGEAIRKAVKRAGTRVKHAAVAIGGASVITKTISMPATLSDKELGEQIELQADQYIPFPLEEVAFDYEIVGPSPNDPDMVDVLLAATRRENVEQRQAVLEAAGLIAKVVDIEAYALENACRLLTYQMPDEGLDKTIAIVDFGSTTTTFSVLHDRKIIYTRDQAFGGKQLTEEIMRHYGLSYEEAGKAKREGGLPSNYKTEILDPFVEDMAQQVNRSIQFFLSAQSDYSQLDQIIVCGGCATIPGAAAHIQERLGTPTVVGDPFGQMQISSKAKSQLVESDSPALMIACGLALRSFD
ncbi:MAG TPA: pilus assembly protein PilM [Gammaproteobacteria bacterium]|nr:pilus assembly protein PilM [Gammaproteobacteria bacterium]